MKIVILKGLLLAGMIGLFLSSSAFGQTVVNFGITGPGPTSNNLAGVYTDPYEGCVGCTEPLPGLVVGGTSVLAFCDDFTNEVNPPEAWTAFATNLNKLPDSPNTVYYDESVKQSSSNGGNYSFLTGDLVGFTFSETELYTAVAYLAMESLQATGPNAETEENDLSFALWGVFDPTLLDQASNASGTLPTSDWNSAKSELQQALQVAYNYQGNVAAFESAYNISTVFIYSAETGGVLDSSSSRPQEFVTVTMPEPSALAALAFDFIGVGIIGLVFRRRRLRSQS